MARHREKHALKALFARLRPKASPEIVFRRRQHILIGTATLLLALAIINHLYHPQAFAPPLALAAADYARYHKQTFRVTRVVDGDTLYVDASDRDQSETIIRLWGVDTPEIHDVPVPMHFGPEASAFTHAAVADRFVRLELVPDNTRDRYGRLLAYVYLPDGTMLNELLVQQGYAYADTRFAHPRKADFARLEKAAAKAGIGLWREVTPDKMPPWRRQREKPAVSQPTCQGSSPWSVTATPP